MLPLGWGFTYHNVGVHQQQQLNRKRVDSGMQCLQCVFSLVCLVWMFVPSLKMECDKLANEKTEMQRHYVMVSSSSRGAAGTNHAAH